jgi:hypothetical protein
MQESKLLLSIMKIGLSEARSLPPPTTLVEPLLHAFPNPHGPPRGRNNRGPSDGI